MKKYLGSKETAFAAIIAPLFICCPLLFAVSALRAKLSGATVLLTLGCLACAFIWGLYIKRSRYTLYSWGHFRSGSIQITTIFSKPNVLIYEQCKGCGIGYYTHGILNSKVGKTVYFIFFSADVFDEKFRSNINLWEQSPTRVKAEFNEKIYDYLISVLPRKQAQMLRRDYVMYKRSNTHRQ